LQVSSSYQVKRSKLSFSSSKILPAVYWAILLSILLPFISPAQDMQYARKVVDTLASPSMHGRGYVNDGDKIAATYLENEFRRLGIRSFDKSYRQEFTMSVNTFPGKMKLSIDGIALTPGSDFIVSPESKGSSAKKCKVIRVDSSLVFDQKKQQEFSKADLRGKALIIDERSKTYSKRLDSIITVRMRECEGKFPKAIIYIKSKLTWSVSQQENSSWMMLEVLDNKIPANAKSISWEIKSHYVPQYKTQNLIGYIPGTQYPDSFIVFSAHYDHLGVMGMNGGRQVYFPGANDNASGCAMLLNLAKYYSEHPPKFSVAFMAFGAEEAGLLGSKYYTEHPLFPMNKMSFLVNLDLEGTGDEGVTVVNGSIYSTAFKVLQLLNAQGSYLKDIKLRGKAANSDHYFFTEKGVKAFFIYTMGGIKAYHDIYDRPETLPLTEFEDLFLLLRDFEGELEHVK
jgi:aminopeptidase YwaD